MKRLLVIIISLVVGVVASLNLSAATKKVAVYVAGPQSQEEKNIVESAFVARLSSSRDYIPFERNRAFVKAMDLEEGYQLSGEVPEKEIRKVGERMGVDYVIVVWFNVGDENICDMSARLIHLESGEIAKSLTLQRECNDNKELRNMANSVVYRLLDPKSK